MGHGVSTYSAPSVQDFKKGTRVRAIKAHKEDGVVWYEKGDEGTVRWDPKTETRVRVHFDRGHDVSMDPARLKLLSDGPWEVGARVQASADQRDGAGGWLYKEGDQGELKATPAEHLYVAVLFDRWKHDLSQTITIGENNVLQTLEIIWLQVHANPRASIQGCCGYQHESEMAEVYHYNDAFRTKLQDEVIKAREEKEKMDEKAKAAEARLKEAQAALKEHVDKEKEEMHSLVTALTKEEKQYGNELDQDLLQAGFDYSPEKPAEGRSCSGGYCVLQ